MNTLALQIRVPAWLRPAPDSMWRQMQRTSTNPHLHLLNFLWSLWVLATLFFTEVDALFWWSLTIGYGAFVFLFALVHVRPRAEMRAYAGLMALDALVSMLWNPSGWTFAVFACVYTGMASADAPRTGMLRIGMIEAMVLALAWWLDWPWFILIMAASVCTSAGLGAMFGYISQLHNSELRHSHEEVRRLAATAERERIGRDLHDLLGHTLSLITMKLELSRRLFDRDHEAARRELTEAEHVARQALAEVRAAVTGIRATDLVAEMASARLMLESSGVELTSHQVAQALPENVERALALILREAVTNVARHAHATRVDLDLSIDGGNAQLSIVDNGRGGVDEEGNGLRGMRERTRALGGVLRLDSSRARGTALRVMVPLPATRPPPLAPACADVAGSEP